jgi:hypothetical protein
MLSALPPGVLRSVRRRARARSTRRATYDSRRSATAPSCSRSRSREVPFLDLPGAGCRDRCGHPRGARGSRHATQQFVLGPHVTRFETAWRRTAASRTPVGVASGTDALALALDALGAGPGRAVVTTPFSFFATAEHHRTHRARPVFADVDPDTLNLDPAAAARRSIGAADAVVAASMPVHLFGRLRADGAAPGGGRAAAAVGARGRGAGRRGTRERWCVAGAFGVAGCLSFYPTKNLGGLGDGGMVLTDDDGIAARCGANDTRGSARPYVHDDDRALLAARCPAGGRPRGEAPPPRRLERATASRWRVVRDRAPAGRARRRCRRPDQAPRRGGRGARVSPVRRPRPGSRRTACVPDGRPAIDTQVYYSLPLSPAAGAGASGTPRGRISPTASAPAARSSRYRSTPSLRKRPRKTVVEAIARLLSFDTPERPDRVVGRRVVPLRSTSSPMEAEKRKSSAGRQRSAKPGSQRHGFSILENISEITARSEDLQEALQQIVEVVPAREHRRLLALHPRPAGAAPHALGHDRSSSGARSARST